MFTWGMVHWQPIKLLNVGPEFDLVTATFVMHDVMIRQFSTDIVIVFTTIYDSESFLSKTLQGTEIANRSSQSMSKPFKGPRIVYV